MHKGQEITELTFRRATVADLRKIDEAFQKSGIDSTVISMSLLAGVDKAAFEAMDFEDWQDASLEMKEFLPKARSPEETGG
jgi:hypothetical protein